MDHLLTDYAVQIRNRMQNQAERALSQAKKITPSGNGSVYYDPFPLGVIFQRYWLFRRLHSVFRSRFYVLRINNSQLFFQNKPSDVHMSGILQELPVLHVRIRSYGISSQEERRP